MNMNEDKQWQSLLSHSATAFTGDAVPPYGFMASTLARLKEKKNQQEQLEKIGIRAFLISIGALVIVAAITMDLHFQNRSDLEPGVRSLIQVENVQLS